MSASAPQRRWIYFFMLVMLTAGMSYVGAMVAYSGGSAVPLIGAVVVALILWCWLLIQISHATADFIERKD